MAKTKKKAKKKATKERTRKKTKKKTKSKKKCLHNIMVRNPPDDNWYCGRCGKKLSEAMVRKKLYS